MKSILGILIIFIVGCKEQAAEKELPIMADTSAEIIPTYSFDEFEELLYLENDQTYIINFWATWCKPCIKELPYFEQLRTKYLANGVEVILVSLDFPEQIESQLIPFIKKRNLQSEVVLLDDPDGNRWIPKVNKDWSGAIPATVIYNGEKRAFYERSFSYEELEEELALFL